MAPDRQRLPAQRRARQPHRIDLDELADLAQLGLTPQDLARHFAFPSVTEIETLLAEEPWQRAYRHGCGMRNIALRAAQMQVAVQDRNATILIWLGKQYLGQTDQGLRPEPKEPRSGASVA